MAVTAEKSYEWGANGANGTDSSNGGGILVAQTGGQAALCRRCNSRQQSNHMGKYGTIYGAIS
jgi:hypothetical protein